MSHGQPGEQPTEGQEFDRLFALDDPDQTEEQQPATPAPASTAAGEAGKDTGGQSATGDGGEGGGASTVQPAATDTSGEDDWLASANLPDDVVARIKADREARDAAAREAQDRYQALHGRLAPTQQALAEAQRRIAQMSRPAPAGQPVQSPPVMQPGQTTDSFFDSDDWKAYASDFPGDAKVMRAAIEANAAASQSLIHQMEQRLNQLTQRLAQTEQVTTRAVVNEEISLLEKRHPDWMEINNSDEFWGWFDQWRASQPKSVRGQYYDEARLGEMFNDAEWTGSLLDSYKAARQPVATQQQPPVQPTPPESTAPAQPQQPAANGRLAMSVAPTVRGGAPVPHAVSLEGMTEAEAFDTLWKQTD